MAGKTRTTKTGKEVLTALMEQKEGADLKKQELDAHLSVIAVKLQRAVRKYPEEAKELGIE